MTDDTRDKKCSTSAQVLHDEDVRLVRESLGQVYRAAVGHGADYVAIDAKVALAAFDRILATIDRQSRLLAAYEAEHEAVAAWRHNEWADDEDFDDYQQRSNRLIDARNAASDEAERMRKEEGL